MTLSVPDVWTVEEVRTRFNVREQAPAFRDGSLSTAQERALADGWKNLEEVAVHELESHSTDPEVQKTVGSIYEAAFHFTAAVAPAAA